MKKRKNNPTRPFLKWKRVLIFVFAVFLVLIYGVLPPVTVSFLLMRAASAPRQTGAPPFAVEEVHFPATDGLQLSGWWFSPKKRPRGVVLLTHGIFKTRLQVEETAKFWKQEGFALLWFDLRGHGESAAAPPTGGVREALDFQGAVAWLKETGRWTPPVFLHGFSLGAAAALRAAAEGEANGVIAESPVAKVSDYLRRRTPAGVFSVLPFFLDICFHWYAVKTGVQGGKNWNLVDAVSVIPMPVMLLASPEDDVVHSKTLQRWMGKLQAPFKRIFIFPGGRHEPLRPLYPGLYRRALLEFVDEVENRMQSR